MTMAEEALIEAVAEAEAEAVAAAGLPRTVLWSGKTAAQEVEHSR